MLDLSKLSRRVLSSVATIVVGLSLSTGTVPAVTPEVMAGLPVDVKVADGNEDPNYWTAERRAAAKPLTPDEVNRSITPVDPSESPAHTLSMAKQELVVLAEPVGPSITRHREVTMSDETGGVDTKGGEENHNVQYGEVPPTVGRLYFTREGEARHCTASVVNNNDRNVIMTAAHCVHDGRGGDWRDNFTFYPMYDNGHGPGQRAWRWTRAMAPRAWMNDSVKHADQAFIELKPHGVTTIVDHVGGNGLIYHGDYNRDDVVAWGYPSLYGYNGFTPYFCEGSVREGLGDDVGQSVMECGFNSGASGGPWLVDREEEGRGFIYAITSMCGRDNDSDKICQADPRTILATPNGAYVENMFEKIQVGDWTSD